MIEFITFGTKHARIEPLPPYRAHIAATFLPNPPRAYWATRELTEKWLITKTLFVPAVHAALAERMEIVVALCQRAEDEDQNLRIVFSCIGGKHRSVFLAERMAQHLEIEYGIEVTVRHLDVDR